MKLQLTGITKRFGPHVAVDGVDLEVRSGELAALLGPSGSGKTTLLRIIAGIETADAGRVCFDERDVTALAVREREIGFVFQSYALFEHMTVAQNVAFGLRVRKAPPAEIRQRVDELLALVRLETFADRFPRQLSGGQQQRVALARALAPRPRILLLDEPFGALDAKVRVELRQWLRRLHTQIPVTTVLVTHDREEALAIADRIVVLDAGRVEQSGSPEQLLDAPASGFVMGFLGDVNVIDGVAGSGAAAGALTFGPFRRTERAESSTRGSAAAYVRTVDLAVQRRPNGLPHAPAVVSEVRRVGALVRVELAVEGLPRPLLADLAVHEWQALQLAVGERVYAAVRDARVFGGTEPVSASD
jgi:sulfate/thiosulfate transport system ATP-binding protein